MGENLGLSNNTISSSVISNLSELVSLSDKDFDKILDNLESGIQTFSRYDLVKGIITNIGEKEVIIDIGAKSVGSVKLEEFRYDGEIQIGDVTTVFIVKDEDRNGDIILSRRFARRMQNWNYIKQCMNDEVRIKGSVISEVKGGFAVRLFEDMLAFLPKGQVDIVLMDDYSYMMNQEKEFMVIKVDEVRQNIVVSSRAIVEQHRKEKLQKVIEVVKVGDVLDGIIKNVVSYGAFVDLDVGCDGLLHVTDMSWCRVKDPSELFKIGQRVTVKIIKIDDENKKISLGIKQLHDNPWKNIKERYPVGTVIEGEVSNIANYGALVKVDSGIEGLVHVSEISWSHEKIIPTDYLKPGQKINVMVLDVDPESYRLSLGIKQCTENPWKKFAENHEIGDVFTGNVKNVIDFGMFIEVQKDIVGLLHFSDIAWEGDGKELLKKYKEGDKVKVMLIGSDHEKCKISLGIKQISVENFKEKFLALENTQISCVVCYLDFAKACIEVENDLGIKGIIRKADLSDDPAKQKIDRFSVGDRLDGVKVTSVNKINGKIILTLKNGGSENSFEEARSESTNNYATPSVSDKNENSFEDKKQKTENKDKSSKGKSDRKDYKSYKDYEIQESTGATLGNILGAILDESKDRIAESEKEKK